MDRYKLEIAKIHFSIHSPVQISLASIKPKYKPFFEENARDDLVTDLDIHLVFDDFPYKRPSGEVFNSGESWSMHHDDSEYHIDFNPRKESAEPYWQARFNPECTEVHIHCSDEMIVREDDQAWVKNPVQYPLDQLLTVYHIGQRAGALIHAAGAIIAGRGIIFPGRSGAGKSTITKQFPADDTNFELLSDDRIIVRKMDENFEMFGTPWPGEAGIAKNASYPLHGIAFIHHGVKNEINRLEPAEALKQLLPVVSIPWYDEGIMKLIVAFCEGLATSIPAYDLHFKPSVEIAGFLENFFVDTTTSEVSE